MAGQQCFFFFNDTATAEIYTLSLHDALPICRRRGNEQERSAEHDSGGEPKCTRPVRRGSREPRLEHLFIPPKRPDAGFTGGNIFPPGNRRCVARGGPVPTALTASRVRFSMPSPLPTQTR